MMLSISLAPFALVPGLHAITHARRLIAASPCSMSSYQPTRRAALGAAAAAFICLPAHAIEADYSAVAADLQSMIKADPDIGPTMLRLAWHSSGTFDKISKTGGSKGGNCCWLKTQGQRLGQTHPPGQPCARPIQAGRFARVPATEVSCTCSATAALATPFPRRHDSV